MYPFHFAPRVVSTERSWPGSAPQLSPAMTSQFSICPVAPERSCRPQASNLFAESAVKIAERAEEKALEARDLAEH